MYGVISSVSAPLPSLPEDLLSPAKATHIYQTQNRYWKNATSSFMWKPSYFLKIPYEDIRRPKEALEDSGRPPVSVVSHVEGSRTEPQWIWGHACIFRHMSLSPPGIIWNQTLMPVNFITVVLKHDWPDGSQTFCKLIMLLPSPKLFILWGVMARWLTPFVKSYGITALHWGRHPRHAVYSLSYCASFGT